MQRAITIKQDLTQIGTVENLTQAFEGIASLKIAKLRNKVVDSKAFFEELWVTYSGLRINPKEQLARKKQAKNARRVFVVISSEGGLDGGIDEGIIDEMIRANTKPQTTDIVIIGSHALAVLNQRHIESNYFFHLPESDDSLDIAEIIELLNEYSQITVFYQTYKSLRTQGVAQIELVSAVRELAVGIDDDSQIISSNDYIFEPNITKIADYLESVMLGVALTQVIMESKLSQYATRFNTMTAARQRAIKLKADYRLDYYRAKRSESDERLKEMASVVNVMRRTMSSGEI